MKKRLDSKINLNVYVCLHDGTILKAGRLLSLDLDKNNKAAHFKYDPGYLADGRAYSLDPENIPLTSGVVSKYDTEHGMLDVFRDSLPGSWGTALLANRGGIDVMRSKPAHLLSVLGTTGLGGLLYSSSGRTQQVRDVSIPFEKIENALREVASFERQTWTDKGVVHLQQLLACGSSAGGAQPKVLTKYKDQSWIAKPCSIKENPQSTTALEYAGLQLAKQAGVVVPEIKFKEINERQVLLIKRFDVISNGGRAGMISFRTLMGIEDPTTTSYSALAEILRKHSHQPTKDLEQLFRQMVVNVALNNADGHLQNFSMIHKAQGWELSPAYDIVPNIYQTYHLLAVNQKHTDIGFDDLFVEGKAFGFSPVSCRGLITDVTERLVDWHDVFAKANVPTKETEKLCKYIGSVLQKISVLRKPASLIQCNQP